MGKSSFEKSFELAMAAVNYETAKAKVDQLNDEYKRLSDELNKFPKNAMGLVPDEIKRTVEYRSIKEASDKVFATLRAINPPYLKKFKVEISAEREARRKRG